MTNPVPPQEPVSILGLNAYHGDSSACLFVGGELVAACEEERFRRQKHWAGFPSEAVSWCLAEAGLAATDLDHVAINRDPGAKLLSKVLFALSRRPDLSLLVDRVRNASRVRSTQETLARSQGFEPDDLGAQFHGVEHHRAHMASAFYASPFESAAVASVDGFGDFSSSMWGRGEGTQLATLGSVSFPHSLGLFYLAMTQYLGFEHYGDEYKVMGLAAYGAPVYADRVSELVRLVPGGGYRLNLEHFRHHSEGVEMSWEGGEPRIGCAYAEPLVELLGPPRKPGEPLEQRHRDLAASVQSVYEDALFHLLGHLLQASGEDRLCLAGGCAMNSLANGRIFERTDFREVYVQAAAGDAGGALGAALVVWNEVLAQPRIAPLEHAYFGPRFTPDQVQAALDERLDSLVAEAVTVRRVERFEELAREVAEAIDGGAVVGWFQGRSEWGPRALGNRSILADPRRSDMKERLNAKIKLRESFRPFAPSVLAEEVGQWFELDRPVPFMSQVFPVREQRRPRIPAVVHEDGTGRLQTVEREANPRFHRLIQVFHERSGVPMLVNTSFNENEPVVNTPAEALDCFLRTRMDLLVMGNHLLRRA